MTPPEPPPGAAPADDLLHAEWLRLGAAFAAFDRSVRGGRAVHAEDTALLPTGACTRGESPDSVAPGAA